jgi:hypothetical protein
MKFRKRERTYKIGSNTTKDVKKPKKPKKRLKFSLQDYGGWHFRPIFAFWRGFGFRLRLMLLLGIIFLLGVYWAIYGNWVRFPPVVDRDVEHSGLGAVLEWENTYPNLDDSISSLIGVDSYLAMEVDYANSDENILDFQKTVVGTVDYIPEQVEVKNIYGNTALDHNYKKVYVDSLVDGEDEEVTVSYVDYSKIRLNKDLITSIMNKYGVSKDNRVDMANALIPVFCEYISTYDELPITEEQHIPYIENYKITSDEDVYLDTLLFSSQAFSELLQDFSIVAVGGEENPEWVEWLELTDKEKFLMDEPERVLIGWNPTDTWTAWSALSDEEKESTTEPYKYDWRIYLSDKWCGAYNLYNGVESEAVYAGLGDGTLESPAGLDTSISTVAFVDEYDESGVLHQVKVPIRIKLKEYGVSQDAIDFFESKDARNRGYDIKSELQYIYYVFEITNLSDKEVRITDETVLCDDSLSLSGRTGTVYGLQGAVTLQPYQSGILESWSGSVSLNKKYLIWGSDFSRNEEVVWFRVMAGDIDNSDESKGVELNNSRYDEE